MAAGEENRDDHDSDGSESPGRGDRSQERESYSRARSGDEYDAPRYEPSETSFFAPSSEERAEQARRAVQRVRRRPDFEEESSPLEPHAAEPEEVDIPSAAPAPGRRPTPVSAPQYTAPKPTPPPPPAPKPAPPPAPEQTARAAQPIKAPPAPAKSSVPKQPPPVAEASMMDRALERAVPPPLMPKQVSSESASQPAKPEKKAMSSGSIMDRATERPLPKTDPAVEKPESDRASLMDRALQSPPKQETKPGSEIREPATKKASPSAGSIMDRATDLPSPKSKNPSRATFNPEAVLSAAPRPRSPGAGSKRGDALTRKTSKLSEAVAKTKSPRPNRSKPVEGSALSDRMEGLSKARKAQKKQPSAPTAQSSAPKPQPSALTPHPTSAGTSEKIEPRIDAPTQKPPLAPKVSTDRATTELRAIAPVQSDAMESIYADRAIVTPKSGVGSLKTKPFAPFEWMVASRYLRSRKKEGFVSVIAGFSLVGIALGVATLIVVMAVMTGFRETLITQIIGGSPHINVYSQSEEFKNYDTLADQIRTVDGVTNVTPVVQGQVLGTGNQRHTGVIVRGMRKDDLQRLIENAEPEVVNGSLENFVEDKGVALGADLAAKLGLRVGDFITLISPDGDITPFQATPMPRVKDYKIIQTFKLGVQEIDYGVAFMTFEEAQIYFNKQEQADTLDVFVDDPQSVSASLRNIEPDSYEDNIFRSARSSISVNNWKNLNGRLIGAINLERQVMFVILTMIILVAALNIISGLVMLVKDKARDVAIMRTMGMARGSILRIFFICGSSIGVIGSILGVILGVAFVLNIHAIQGFVEWVTGTRVWDPSVRAGIAQIPTKLQFSDVALTLFIALGLSFIATLFPAWKAAKLDPVEALRYE